MKIAIVDADLIKRKKHRFPNLACMKMSAYYKDRKYHPNGNEVELAWSYENLDGYDKILISKVFTDTQIPEWLEKEFEEFRNDPNREKRKIQFGGTGFYFDKAPNLPDVIEHHMPDYDLYTAWIENAVLKEQSKCVKENRTFDETKFRAQFKEYTDYSIGFLTRGCFRKCPFCVNQKYSHVFGHSSLSDFYDKTRKKICLLDDNFFGYNGYYDCNGIKLKDRGEVAPWKELLGELKATGKPFKFKQGLDERLLTREICEELFSSNYDGDYTFAFDNIQDYDLIHQKLEIIRSVPMSKKASVRFYVLVGFVQNEEGVFQIPDASDIENAFRRIELLQKYRCLPYIMRFQSKNDKPWQQSNYSKLYVEMARWCNQPSFFKKKSFHEYCWACEEYHHSHGGRAKHSSTWQAYLDFKKDNPQIEKKYFHLKFGEINRIVGEPVFAKQQRKRREKLLNKKRGSHDS
ncbi:MAG: hypothetical protein MJ109_02010 [Kiritimatiellae bacterium]|nr:hypothetical protein [Kiritimatiellia bacterium]